MRTVFKFSCNYLRVVASGLDYNSKHGDNQKHVIQYCLFFLMDVTWYIPLENIFCLAIGGGARVIDANKIFLF